ncbi:MAG: alpha-amylase family glycosyl hydrolase, partial [Deltaproteobacteria bacterium]
MNPPSLSDQASLSLKRLKPRWRARFLQQPTATEEQWQILWERTEKQFPALFDRLHALYGGRYDFFYHLEEIIFEALKAGFARSIELKQLDIQRLNDPLWIHNQKMLGATGYVDLQAGNLEGIRQQISYYRQLGLTYLHLMPLFSRPEGENDGGYAVSSYRDVDPPLGTMEELAQLAQELREAGISLVVDFIFNHTANNHEWACKAKSGDLEFQGYYWMFDKEEETTAWQQYLRLIFPDRGGSFTWCEDVQKWVWTTFFEFQWDLNYSNPEVFRGMLAEMLFLANKGIEILRMDAVAFIWKRLGTDCENQPEAHWILQAYNALCAIAAPALLLKSEAIVHPDEVARYIRPDECRLSYNPLLMALLWESLATRNTRLLHASLQARFPIDPECTWVNYLRCHDDIGWTFDDAIANQLGIDGAGHRKFLNDFYTGRFPGSFAKGLPFQENPITGDARISGTLASLAGLEAALISKDLEAVDLAIGRILLLYSIIFSIGGIPLVYLGDESAMLNDYSFAHHPEHASDSRWVHRPVRDWSQERQALNDPNSPAARIYAGIQYRLQLRRSLPVLSQGQTEFLNIRNDHVFAYIRHQDSQRLLLLCNFTERSQSVSLKELKVQGFSDQAQDLLTSQTLQLSEDLYLAPYQTYWLQ